MLLARQQAFRCQSRECFQSVAGPQVGLRTADDQLHELGGELDIPDAADPLFDIHIRVPGAGNFLFETPLVAANTFDKTLFDPAGIDERCRHPCELCPDFWAARHKPCFEQGLPLPGFRPGFVIGPARLQGARNGPKPTLGPQPQVYAKDKPGVGGLC